MARFTALIDGSLDLMLAYYRIFNTDDTWVGQIELAPNDIIGIPGITFPVLLHHIRTKAESGVQRLLIGIHGSPSNLGLTLLPGVNAMPTGPFLDQLAVATGTNNAADQAKTWLRGVTQSSGGAPLYSGKNAPVLDRMIDDLRAIRKARLRHVEFRGCRIGADPSMLESIRACLGAEYAVAPTTWVMTVRIRPGGSLSPAALRQRYNNVYAMPKRIWTRTECALAFDARFKDDEPAVAMHWHRAGSGAFSGDFASVSPAATEGWTKAYLENWHFNIFGQRPAGGGYRSAGGPALPLVGLWDPNGTPAFIFPGDNYDYLNKLATASG